jgi:FAD/FMN-containing dehydrogenase
MDYTAIFSSVLETSQIAVDKDTCTEYGRDWLQDFIPKAKAVLFPVSSEQVSQIIKLCNINNIKIVPSGGRTGLSGGAAAINDEVVLSLEKMNKVFEINSVERTVTCEAGVITENLQNRLKDKGLFLPIDFASKGSSQLGGNVSTNAGGIRVIRWGLVREWVLGLTVVTGKGDILRCNGTLFKNQTGYDFKSLFIGSEGTLGVITEITFKLTTLPEHPIRLLLGFNCLSSQLPLFEKIRKNLPFINVFEFFTEEAMSDVLYHRSLQRPLSSIYKYYNLIEIEPSLNHGTEHVEALFSSLIEDGSVEDLIISQNQKQAEELLQYRESISETLSVMYMLHKNDISVPIASSIHFLEEFTAKLPEFYISSIASAGISESEFSPEGLRMVIFGHIGDGNLHLNLTTSKTRNAQHFFKLCKYFDRHVFSLIQRYNGSISAEHGVGLLKKDFLLYTRTEIEITFMREVKKVFDPNAILNPGKIFTL